MIPLGYSIPIAISVNIKTNNAVLFLHFTFDRLQSVKSVVRLIADRFLSKKNYIEGSLFLLEEYGSLLGGEEYHSKFKRHVARGWALIASGFVAIVSLVALLTLLIIYFCCKEKRTYTPAMIELEER